MKQLVSPRPLQLLLRLATPALLLLPIVACGGGASDVGGEGRVVDAGEGDGASETEPDASDQMPSGARVVLTPSNAEHVVGADGLPTLTFSAELSPKVAEAQAAKWSSDHPELGSIDPNTGVFTPTGAAGTLTISAQIGARSASTSLKLMVQAKQEGDPEAGGEIGGAGGAGGVGGEGGGTAITDKAVRDALDSAASVDPTLSWLYPYDRTVWPRGLPAPLLQWKSDTHEVKAIKLRLEVGADFVYEGYLGRPEALAANKPFNRVPIPRQVWKNAQYSGAEMRVLLTIAADDGAGGYKAYKTYAQLTWNIAPGSLKGTVYYNTYGSKLAEQMDGFGGSRFGGATLAIRGNSYEPVLVAGSTTDDESGCRVCHTVSGDGSTMIVQQSDNLVSSKYSLTNMNQETVYPEADNGKFGWAALSPDGSIALGNAGPPGNTAANTASLTTTALYRVSDGANLMANGLSEFVTRAATPVFSVDGRRVAFNFDGGPGTASIASDGRSLVMMDLQKNGENYTFSNAVELFRSNPGQRPGWPFFLPDGSGVIFEVESKEGQDDDARNEVFVTRGGAQGKLWWADLNGNAHPLDSLNGEGYIPTGPNGHEDDTRLQYEPTVAPIVAGGYAWVVFTSRRLYGNVATRNPVESDPRYQDLTPTNDKGPTTKKLWVAAIDMPPKPGTDPSHPAFYLPAQELFAGNSRAFWVPDACRDNGQTCESGDECCGGFCRANSEGVFMCTDELPPAACAEEYESCQTDSDCCETQGAALTCIANRCAQQIILF